MLKISESAYRKVIQEAREAWPLECCGALLGTRGEGSPRVVEVLPAVYPETETAQDRFRISGQDMVRFQAQAERTGWEIMGFYHSHPVLQTAVAGGWQEDEPPTPSQADREGATWTDCYTVIVSMTEDGRSAVGGYLLTGETLATRALAAVSLEWT